MAELKPCPFCGGEAQYKENPVPMIVCKKCEAQIRGAKFKIIPRNYDGFLAELWNRRGAGSDGWNKE